MKSRRVTQNINGRAGLLQRSIKCDSKTFFATRCLRNFSFLWGLSGVIIRFVRKVTRGFSLLFDEIDCCVCKYGWNDAFFQRLFGSFWLSNFLIRLVCWSVRSTTKSSFLFLKCNEQSILRWCPVLPWIYMYPFWQQFLIIPWNTMKTNFRTITTTLRLFIVITTSATKRCAFDHNYE
jgi:hypothetical protein